MFSLIAEMISYALFVISGIQYLTDKYDFTSWTYGLFCAIMAMLVSIRYEKE